MLLSHRYFVEVTLAALCIEWTVVLGVLLLDVSVLTRTVESVRKQGGVEGGVFARIVQGVEEIHSWAESEWYACCNSCQDVTVLFCSLLFLPGVHEPPKAAKERVTSVLCKYKLVTYFRV